MTTMTEDAETQTATPSDTILRLEQARSKAGWMAWCGLGLAIAWWVAGIGGMIGLVGWETISAAQPMLIVAGLIGLLLPGFMLLLAGFLGREQMRAAAANAIVLESAARLLTPAEHMGQEARSFAADMSSASAEVDRAMGHALSAMRAMASEIGDERQRLESVTYASADNARDLAQRLGNERTALEQLTKDLREQTQLVGDAIPRQAGMIVESAKAASEEVASAETALETRLASFDQTGQAMAQKIAALDKLAAEAGQRNETLLFAIARMEEKLEQSRKTVETASRAGELAAAAAGTTGDRLMEAVRAALDGAREASSEIQKRTLETSESAAKALADLKGAGQQAAAAVRAAGMAARAEMDIAERRAAQATNALFETSRTVPGTNEHVPGATNGTPAPLPEPAPAPQAPPVIASPSRAVDDDLFDAAAERFATNALEQGSAEPNGTALFEEDTLAQPEEDTPRDVFDEDQIEPQRNGDTSLSAIIADMERDDQPERSREETAENLLDRLEDSGIRLTEIFRPKDKKKIAFAARKGERQRRSTINQSAGRQVERVRMRLRGDSDLMALARDFVTMEESDALNALENTHASNKNASARLATYLLVDAALS